MKPRISITPKDYQDKRFEASKELLASALNKLDNFNAIGDDKRLESMVSNCIFLADTLLNELGYVSREKDQSKVHSIQSLLDNSEE